MSLLPVHWYYNTETGQLTQGNNLENLGNNLVGGAGWHELNIPGSDTQAQAVAAAKAEFPAGKAPTTSGITPAKVASTAAGEAGASATGVLGTLAGFLGLPSGAEISGKNLAIRAAKIVVGAAMILVGIAKLTGTDRAITAAAKTTAKGALL